MAGRAKPDWAARDGSEWRVVEDEGWRLATDDEAAIRICRRGGSARCDNTVVAAMLRGSVRHVWYFYCPDHMYGRWIEDGRVVDWRMREIGTGPILTGAPR